MGDNGRVSSSGRPRPRAPASEGARRSRLPPFRPRCGLRPVLAQLAPQCALVGYAVLAAPAAQNGPAAEFVLCQLYDALAGPSHAIARAGYAPGPEGLALAGLEFLAVQGGALPEGERPGALSALAAVLRGDPASAMRRVPREGPEAPAPASDRCYRYAFPLPVCAAAAVVDPGLLLTGYCLLAPSRPAGAEHGGAELVFCRLLDLGERPGAERAALAVATYSGLEGGRGEADLRLVAVEQVEPGGLCAPAGDRAAALLRAVAGLLNLDPGSSMRRCFAAPAGDALAPQTSSAGDPAGSSGGEGAAGAPKSVPA